MANRDIGTVLQFGLTADGTDAGDVSELLGRVAHAIEELGAVEIVDLVFRPVRLGTAASVSVYFVRSD
jgi:hypothetical protein